MRPPLQPARRWRAAERLIRLVGTRERIGDLDAVAEHLIDRERTFLEPFGQRLSLEVLHDEVVDAVLASDVVERADVGMRKLRDRFRLALEAELHLRIPRELRREHLDGNTPVEPGIASFENFAHPASADARDDLVRAKTLTRAEHAFGAAHYAGGIARSLFAMMESVKRAFLFIAFAILTSCSAPTNDVPATTAADTSSQPLALSQRCRNEAHGFTIAYPAGWHVAACSAFDPEPVQVSAQSEMPFDIAIVIGMQQVPFDRVGSEPRFERVLASERLTIGGRPAVRAEVEATGEGLADRGMRTLRYAIDLGGGRSLVATTNRTNDSYEQEKEILGRMLETIEIR